MVNPKSETLALIAQFIEPNPVVYTRLAMVSKDFYIVFTSDDLWGSLDACELKIGIFKDFISSARNFKGILREMWLQDGKKDPIIKKARKHYAIKNRYAYMGYMMNGRNREHKDDVKLMRLIASIKPSVIKEVPNTITQDPVVILNSFSHGKMALDYADKSLKANKDLCASLVEAMSKKWIPDNWKGDYSGPINILGWFNRSVLDREMVEYAFKVFPSCLLYPDEWGSSRCNEYICDKVAELLENREKLLEIIPGNYEFLRMMDLECWKDKELCIRALAVPNQDPNKHRMNNLWIRCDDPEIVKAYVVAYPNFSYVPGDCLENKDIVVHALQNIYLGSASIKNKEIEISFPTYIGSSLWSDPEIITLALDKGYRVGICGFTEGYYHHRRRLETLEELRFMEEYLRREREQGERERLEKYERDSRIERGEYDSDFDRSEVEKFDMSSDEMSDDEENCWYHTNEMGGNKHLVKAEGSPSVPHAVDSHINSDDDNHITPQEDKKYEQGDFLAIALADKKVLESLFDDRAWMEARIKVRSETWNFASSRLKKDRELFLLAIKGEIAIKNAPKGLVEKSTYRRKLAPCPKVFHNDEEVLRALSVLRPIREVPRTKLVKKIIEDTAKTYHGMLYYGSQSERDIYSGDLRCSDRYSEPEWDTDDCNAMNEMRSWGTGYGY